MKIIDLIIFEREKASRQIANLLEQERQAKDVLRKLQDAISSQRALIVDADRALAILRPRPAPAGGER